MKIPSFAIRLCNSAIPIKNKCNPSLIYSDQLVFYFEKIKHENKKFSPAHYVGQIKMMSNWMETCIKVHLCII